MNRIISLCLSLTMVLSTFAQGRKTINFDRNWLFWQDDAVQAESVLCPITDNVVRFSVSGGNLLGVENGNMADLGSVRASERKAWSGMCLGIIGATHPGNITVIVDRRDLNLLGFRLLPLNKLISLSVYIQENVFPVLPLLAHSTVFL